jgi:predicted ester cyclase
MIMRRFAVAVLLGSAIVLSLLPATAQEATPSADCPTTTPEGNKELVRSWFAALSEGAAEDIGAISAPGIVYHDASPQKDPQVGGATEWASKRQQDFPDFQVTIEQLVAEGDMVASYNLFAGTQQSDLEDKQGITGTGVQTEWAAAVFFRIECGKIAEVWSLADHLGRLQRQGVITAEELSSVEPVATPAP